MEGVEGKERREEKNCFVSGFVFATEFRSFLFAYLSGYTAYKYSLLVGLCAHLVYRLSATPVLSVIHGAFLGFLVTWTALRIPLSVPLLLMEPCSGPLLNVDHTSTGLRVTHPSRGC